MNRALLVGINKYPTQPLNGCVNDVEDMAKFLVAKCGFAMNDIRLLVDERATKDAIIERLGWLLTGLNSGDRVLFHYSGHGVQVPTRNPQGEADGLDEAICPVDFDFTDAHTIRDKDFNRIFSSIPAGVEFIWVSDSCHSADLSREVLKKGEQPKSFAVPADINWRLQTALQRGIHPIGFQRAASALNLALISGCKSDQTSSDAYFGNRANGALTYYLLKQLQTANGLSMSLTDLVAAVNTALNQAHYSQQPQLEGSASIKAKAFLAH
ncbi:MAG: caspase family protein [Bacteroidetes bacterium]|nr:caspase family protein [Bacteroidota bacterium]